MRARKVRSELPSVEKGNVGPRCVASRVGAGVAFVVWRVTRTKGRELVALRRRVAFAYCCCIFRGIRDSGDDTYTFRVSTPTKSEPHVGDARAPKKRRVRDS